MALDRTRELIMRKQTLLIIVLVLLAAALGSGLFARHALNMKGTVKLVLNVTDSHGLAVKFNGQTSKETGTTYHIKPGDYTIVVSKPGFKDFSMQFSLNKSQPVTINVRLPLSSDSTITDVAQLAIPNIAGIPDIQIGGVQYFYDKTWAVVTLQSSVTDTAQVVVQYDAPSAAWHTTLGPGTLFDPFDVQKLPPQVAGYLNANNFVTPGGGGGNNVQ